MVSTLNNYNNNAKEYLLVQICVGFSNEQIETFVT